MKSTKNLHTVIITAFLFVLVSSIFVSCIKDRDYDIKAADDANFAIWAYDNAISIANEAYTFETGGNLVLYKTTGYCATVTNNPGQLIVDFDTVNCLCNDGRNRRGKIIIDYTGEYKDSNETRTISFEDYYINDNQINGTEIITGLGSDDNGFPSYQVVVDGVIDVQDTLGAFTYKADMIRTWTAGFGSVQWEDDVYQLNGNGQGINEYGNNYAFNTLEPLYKPTALICRFFTQGILEVQPQGRTFRSVDYGSGSCDKTAIVTIDNKQHNLELE